MRPFVPLRNERQDTLFEVRLAVEIDDAQALSLQNAKPLLHLVHPGAMHRRVMPDKTRVQTQPFLHLLARMHSQVIQDHMHHPNALWYLSIQLLQEGNELCLALPIGQVTIDLARTGIEGGKQIERARTLVFMLDPHRTLRHGPKRRRKTGPGLQVGVLVQAKYPLILCRWTRIQITNGTHACGEGGVAHDLGGEPHLVTPGLETVALQSQAYGFPADGLYDLVPDQLPSDLLAVPDREGTSARIGAFTGQFDDVLLDLRGKKRACVPVLVGLAVLLNAAE